MADTTQELQTTHKGSNARFIVLAVIFGLLLSYPLFASSTGATLYSKAAAFAIIGLSLNILMGYAGQISLGHNAFVGVGAFAAAYLTTKSGLPMYLSIVLATAIGATTAVFLGAVALRIQGLYLALITLAYGLMAERSIFQIQTLTGGGLGLEAPRPNLFESEALYAYLCILVLAAVIYLDRRMLASKFGRALLALKSNEQVASSLGMNPVFFKIGAFVMAGALAGLGGGLLAFSRQQVVSNDFDFAASLTFVIMVVIGGLGSRAGVVIGSVVTSYLPHWLDWLGRKLDTPGAPDFIEAIGAIMPTLKIAIPALLLLLTITRFQGGIAQQLHPLFEWLSGRPVPHGAHGGGHGHGHRRSKRRKHEEQPDVAA